MTEILLKVEEADHRDIGKYIGRIDKSSMKKLGVRKGDILKIQGKRVTIAIAWPAYRKDKGRENIRMDGRIRRNAGVRLSEKVTVSLVIGEPAKNVILAPTSVPIRSEPRFEEFVKKKLLNCPLNEQDTVFIPILGRAIPFQVVSTEPSNSTVVVKKSTRLNIEDAVPNDIME